MDVVWRKQPPLANKKGLPSGPGLGADHDRNALALKAASRFAGKPGTVAAAKTTGPLTSQQRGSDDGGIDKFDLSTAKKVSNQNAGEGMTIH